MYYGVDATIKYSFMNLIKSKVIDPSLSVGGGYTFFGDSRDIKSRCRFDILVYQM
jgi:hypothetical protein